MQCLSRCWRSPLDSHTRSSTRQSHGHAYGLTRRLRKARASQWPEWTLAVRGTFLILLATVCSFSVIAAAAEPTPCQVPDRLTKNGKALCVRAASILLPQPRLTLAQIANGPDF